MSVVFNASSVVAGAEGNGLDVEFCTVCSLFLDRVRGGYPMIRRCVVLLFVITLIIGTGRALTQMVEPAEMRLQNAKQEFNAQNEKARKDLLQHYTEVLKAHAENGKLDLSLKVREEMKLFEENGILLGSPELKDHYLEYGRSLKGARDTLAAAYEEAIKQLTKAEALDKAEELQKEYAVLALKAPLNSLAVYNRRTAFVQHADYLGWAKKVAGDGGRLNATFELAPGLADPAAVSFRSVNVPNHYLVHANFRLRLVRLNDTSEFRKNATFKRVKGLAAATATSFESVNHPGHFIRARTDGELYLDRYDKSAQFRLDATFVILDPQYKLW